MCAIQLISANIGRVTGRGLAGNMRRHYPAALLYPLVGLLVVANTINIGADLGAMAAALHLLVNGPMLIYVAGFAIVSVLLEVFVRYSRYASVLRWLSLSLFAYVATAFAVVKVLADRGAEPRAAAHRPIGRLSDRRRRRVRTTSISPYLFFWQAGEEVEDEKEDASASPLLDAPEQAPRQMVRMELDTIVGMGFSNVIALFIMLTTAATLNAHGITDIQTSSQAAWRRCVRSPAASPSPSSPWASSAPECWRYRTGRQRRLCGRRGAGLAVAWAGPASRRARAFYGTIAVATCIGAVLNFTLLDPDQGVVPGAPP